MHRRHVGTSYGVQLTCEDQEIVAVHVIRVLRVCVLTQAILRHERIVVADVSASNYCDMWRQLATRMGDWFGSVVHVHG